MIVYEVRKGKMGTVTQQRCNDFFTAEACTNFFPWTCCADHKKMIKDCLDCSRKNFDALTYNACVGRPTAVTNFYVTSLKSAARE